MDIRSGRECIGNKAEHRLKNGGAKGERKMKCESYVSTPNTGQCANADKWCCPQQPNCNILRLFQVGVTGIGTILGIYGKSVQEVLTKALERFKLGPEGVVSIYPPNEREKVYHFNNVGVPVGFCFGGYYPLPIAELSHAMAKQRALRF